MTKPCNPWNTHPRKKRVIIIKITKKRKLTEFSPYHFFREISTFAVLFVWQDSLTKHARISVRKYKYSSDILNFKSLKILKFKMLHNLKIHQTIQPINQTRNSCSSPLPAHKNSWQQKFLTKIIQRRLGLQSSVFLGLNSHFCPHQGS